MNNPYVGQISIVAFNYAPDGWYECNGDQTSISQNPALYSLLDSTFGGDNKTYFCLPDFRGRIPIGVGTGAGLYPIRWGDSLGTNYEILAVEQIPAHTHTADISSATVSIPATTANGTQTAPATGFNLSTAVGSTSKAEPSYIYSDGEANVSLGNGTVTGGNVSISDTGNSGKFKIMQPSLGLYFAIAGEGVYPPRS